MTLTRLVPTVVSTVLFLCFWQASTSALAGQAATGIEPTAFDRAERLMTDRLYEDAVLAYEEALAQDADNGMAWFRMGMALHELGRWSEAIEPYRKAVQLQAQTQSARARLSRVLALIGDIDGAFDELERMAGSGFGAVNYVTGQTDFDLIRSDVRYDALIQQIQANGQPCENQPERRQFDFWIGEWDVFSPRGARLGENRVEVALLGCVIFENWQNTAGRSGKSINLLDQSSGSPTWRQLYVSDFGGVTDYTSGEFKDGTMTLEANVLNGAGTTVRRQMRFTPIGPDSVVQVIEDIDAGGGRTLQFHGIYVRKGASGGAQSEGPASLTGLPAVRTRSHHPTSEQVGVGARC